MSTLINCISCNEIYDVTDVTDEDSHEKFRQALYRSIAY